MTEPLGTLTFYGTKMKKKRSKTRGLEESQEHRTTSTWRDKVNITNAVERPRKRKIKTHGFQG